MNENQLGQAPNLDRAATLNNNRLLFDWRLVEAVGTTEPQNPRQKTQQNIYLRKEIAKSAMITTISPRERAAAAGSLG